MRRAQTAFQRAAKVQKWQDSDSDGKERNCGQEICLCLIGRKVWWTYIYLIDMETDLKGADPWIVVARFGTDILS